MRDSKTSTISYLMSVGVAPSCPKQGGAQTIRKCLALLLIISWASIAQAQTDTTLIGDASDGSQCPAVHHLDLYTHDGFRIFPGVNDDQPFSQRITCGKCHDVQAIIESGWHFNAGQKEAHDGRPGEPWILWDCATATQIPLSYRPWPGTFRPEQIGLSHWQFIQAFGRHLPGGGMAQPRQEEQVRDPEDRWLQSGSLEVQCLICHDAGFGQDLSQLADQIARQNYRWAGTAACDFAWVTGQVRDLPDSWEPGQPHADTPTVTYDATRFSPDHQVTMDIRKRIPNERCLFCHTNHLVGADGSRDVHLIAGLNCVDCHRNGLDHHMIRGYEGEAADVNDLERMSLTCSGCHLGQNDPNHPTAGNLGAPYPQHKGIPTVHFEKLSCTACHSGPRPQAESLAVKTSRAHGLGTHRANRSEETLPHIQTPVFARDASGKLAPHHLVWPSFWAQQQGESIVPLDFELAQSACAGILTPKGALESSSWPDMNEAQVTAVLGKLQQMQSDLSPAYVSGGKLYALKDGKLDVTIHDAAGPVLWPLAHNVRSAGQSLGVRRCEDCHDPDAGLLFGKVAMDGPLVDPNETVPMACFHNLDPTLAGLFARTFVFRPMMKIVCVLACLVIGAVLWIYGCRGLGVVTSVLGRHRGNKP